MFDTHRGLYFGGDAHLIFRLGLYNDSIVDSMPKVASEMSRIPRSVSKWWTLILNFLTALTTSTGKSRTGDYISVAAGAL